MWEIEVLSPLILKCDARWNEWSALRPDRFTPRGTNPLYPPNMGLLGPRESLETSMYSLNVSNECLKSHILSSFLPSFSSSSSPLHLSLPLPSSFHSPHHIHFVHFGIFLSILLLSIVSFSYSPFRTEEGSNSYFETIKIYKYRQNTTKFIILYHFWTTCFDSLESSSGPLVNWSKTIR